MIGQHLQLPQGAKPALDANATATRAGSSVAHAAPEKRRASHLPAQAFFFVLADEFNPFRKKLVRRVIFPHGVTNPELVAMILNPERYGFSPRDPHSPVSIGRHVLGRTDSKFVSASKLPFGSPRFDGKSYYIDAAKVKAAGGTIHNGDAIARDLSRIAGRTNDPDFKAYLEAIRKKAIAVDREVLVEGHIPAGAVKGAAAMALTRGLQFVQGVGIVVSAYDLGRAAATSYGTHSVVPIAKETVRQAGGWGGAWAGAELGGAAGLAVGIETGPGAIITGLVGGLVGGVAGFMGADWVASRMGQ